MVFFARIIFFVSRLIEGKFCPFICFGLFAWGCFFCFLGFSEGKLLSLELVSHCFNRHPSFALMIMNMNNKRYL